MSDLSANQSARSEQSLAEYLGQLATAMQAVDRGAFATAVSLLQSARERGGTIFCCGNGGSASTASHLAADLAKNTVHPRFGRFRTHCLADNAALVTAWGNDAGYDTIFAAQIEGWIGRADVLVVISGSGSSQNVVRAAQAAREAGAASIGLLGFEGGALRQMVDVALVVPGKSIEQAEDGQLILNHALCTAIRARDAERAAE